jgi:hypothetical protein
MSKLKIKTKWSEVTVSEWVQIGQVESEIELNGLNIAKRIKVAAILSNKNEQEIGEMSGANWGKIVEATAFVEKPPRKKKITTIDINGTSYIFHPDPQQMTAGEQASIEQMLVDQKNGGDVATAGILSILIRPAVKVFNEEFNREDITIEKFDTANLDERKQLFLNNLTVDKIWHQWAFFFDLGQKLGRHTLASIPNNRKERRAKK